MARTPTDPDKKMVNFSVNLTPEQRAYVDELQTDLDAINGGEGVRMVLSALQSFFGLPAYQVARLKKDKAAKGQNWITYFQELIARRYEELAAEDARSKKGK